LWFEASPNKKFERSYLEKYFHKNRASEMAHGEDPEFKPQYHQKKKSGRKKPMSLSTQTKSIFLNPDTGSSSLSIALNVPPLHRHHLTSGISPKTTTQN
jgi:hypothetical protein